MIDNCMPGDFNDEAFRIDKQTGSISDFPFSDYMDAIKKIGEDDNLKAYKIKGGASY